MPAQLVALTDGPSILLDKPIVLLGRHPECDIQFDSRKVSRRHCCIALVSDYLIVRDLGSTNGVRINGVRVVEGRIKPGDELTIGSHRYQVQLDGHPVAQVPARSAAVRLNDEQLEHCDSPVPLAESLAGAQPVHHASPVLQPHSPEIAAGPPSPPVAPPQLEMASSSDAFPELPSSPSHHPA